MKKIAIIFIKLSLMMSFIPFQLNAQTASVATETTSTPTESKAAAAAAANVMLARLNEIKAMDKSNLTSSDKKELRKEVKALRTNLKENGNGVYLSVGAIIIIILLLVILL